MKTRTSPARLFTSLGAASLVALNVVAQTPAPTTTSTTTSAAADSAPVRLPTSVEDVVKLSRAQISEEVTLNYIRNSGTVYSLTPKEIVYLRNEGVSDRLINAMLDQRKVVAAETATQTTAQTPAATTQPPAATDAMTAAVPQYAPVYVQPAPTYVQPEPTYTSASTVYVIPYSGPGYQYANTYPYYYGGYYQVGGPSVAVGFGYGGGYCAPRYGGYYGGYYRSGPYHHYGHH